MILIIILIIVGNISIIVSIVSITLTIIIINTIILTTHILLNILIILIGADQVAKIRAAQSSPEQPKATQGSPE